MRIDGTKLYSFLDQNLMLDKETQARVVRHVLNAEQELVEANDEERAYIVLSILQYFSQEIDGKIDKELFSFALNNMVSLIDVMPPSEYRVDSEIASVYGQMQEMSLVALDRVRSEANRIYEQRLLHDANEKIPLFAVDRVREIINEALGQVSQEALARAARRLTNYGVGQEIPVEQVKAVISQELTAWQTYEGGVIVKGEPRTLDAKDWGSEIISPLGAFAIVFYFGFSGNGIKGEMGQKQIAELFNQATFLNVSAKDLNQALQIADRRISRKLDQARETLRKKQQVKSR